MMKNSVFNEQVHQKAKEQAIKAFFRIGHTFSTLKVYKAKTCLNGDKHGRGI
jgi:hypothetical protein